LTRFFEVANNVVVIGGLDVKPLGLADWGVQLMGSPCIFCAQDSLTYVPVNGAERRIIYRKIRIKSDGALEKRNGGGELISGDLGFPS
jgi:hypothetical protein